MRELMRRAYKISVETSPATNYPKPTRDCSQAAEYNIFSCHPPFLNIPPLNRVQIIHSATTKLIRPVFASISAYPLRPLTTPNAFNCKQGAYHPSIDLKQGIRTELLHITNLRSLISKPGHRLPLLEATKATTYLTIQL
jgi:hypothetical protein